MNAVLYPAFALAAWTVLVLMYLAVARIAAVLRGQVAVAEFRAGESNAVPAAVSLVNRNYMNLLELPLLFYVGCLTAYVAAEPSAAGTLAALAWAYVGLRVLHTLVHIGYNNVLHRLGVFATSNFVLVTFWIILFGALRPAS